MAPHTDERSSFPTSFGRHGPRLAPVRASSRIPSRACALVSATILGLHALPTAAAGLDPAKVNADPTAQRTLEAIDAAHHLQPLGTLAHYVLAADAQGQTCPITDKGNDIFILKCELTPQHPAYSLLLTGENGRLLVVSMYGADGHLLPTGDAFERLTAIAPVQPEATTPPTAAATGAAPAAPSSKTATSDRCLWTSVQGQKADMGSLAGLDAFTHQIGGQCYIRTGTEDHATITCRFPDSRTHRTHELVLEGDGDGADCYGITHTALDGRTLPYGQYVRIFVDHK